MTAKQHVREMTSQEAAAVLAELRKGPPPEPPDMSRTAREMSPAERERWIKEHSRRTRSY
jgi:hypothetical protein